MKDVVDWKLLHTNSGSLTRLLFALSLLILPPFQQMVCSLHFSLKCHSILVHFVLMLHLPELGLLQHFSVHKQELCCCCPFSVFLQLLKDVCPDVNQLSFHLRIPPCSCLLAFGRHRPPLSSLLPLHTTEKTPSTAIAVPVTVAIIVTAMVWSQWCHGMKRVVWLYHRRQFCRSVTTASPTADVIFLVLCRSYHYFKVNGCTLFARKGENVRAGDFPDQVLPTP